MQQNQDTLFNQPIVIDNGSGTIRAGFAGDERPKINHSNILGKPKYHKIMPSSISPNDTFIGSKAQSLRGLLKLNYPITKGVITNWTNMEAIWTQIFGNGGLNIKPDQHPVLITEHPLNPRSNRDKIAEVLFETFGFPAIHFAVPAVLALYSSGRTTGLVLDCGDGVTTCVPVYEGFSIPGSIKRLDMGGRDITMQLQTELMKCGYFLTSSSEFEIIRSLKERLGFVSLASLTNQHGILDQLEEDKENEFVLPDGKTIRVNDSSLTKACELIFNPELYGFEMNSMDQIIYSSLLKTDIDLRSQLSQNIILSGGTTLFKNFGTRLLDSVQQNDDELKLKIYASPDRKTSCFVGGSILASLSTFKNIWIGKESYRENPHSIHTNFL